jgi:uncharacterized repeat protein (TIGR02543 family)
MNGQRVWRVLSVTVAMAVLSAAPALGQYVLDLSASPEEAGVVASFPLAADVVEGDEVTVTATAHDGWVFAGWQGDISSDASSLTFPFTGDTTLVAVFVEDVGEGYQLTLLNEPSGAGTLVRDPVQEAYYDNEQVTITVYPTDGFVFTGWAGDLPEDADPNSTVLTVTMDQNRDIYATYSAASTVDETGTDGGACGAIGVVGFGSLLSMMFVLRLGRFGR